MTYAELTLPRNKHQGYISLEQVQRQNPKLNSGHLPSVSFSDGFRHVQPSSSVSTSCHVHPQSSSVIYAKVQKQNDIAKTPTSRHSPNPDSPLNMSLDSGSSAGSSKSQNRSESPESKLCGQDPKNPTRVYPTSTSSDEGFASAGSPLVELKEVKEEQEDHIMPPPSPPPPPAISGQMSSGNSSSASSVIHLCNRSSVSPKPPAPFHGGHYHPLMKHIDDEDDDPPVTHLPPPPPPKPKFLVKSPLTRQSQI